MQLVYVDANTLLNRAGADGFEAAAKQLRDTLRVRLPVAAVLQVGSEAGGNHKALIRLAEALGVSVIQKDGHAGLSYVAGLCKAAPAEAQIHVISDNPLFSTLTGRPSVVWHSPSGIVDHQDTQSRCKANGITLEQWPLVATLSSNPWVNLEQAAQWANRFGNPKAIFSADLSRQGAAGRRLKMYQSQFEASWEALGRPETPTIEQIKWNRPSTQQDKERVNQAYKELGLLHWLDSAPKPGQEIIEPETLDHILDSLSSQTLLGLDITFGPEKKIRQVLLSQHSPARDWVVNVEKSTLGDMLEEKLSDWLSSPRREGKIVTSDFMRMSPWFREHNIPESIVRQDKRLMERYMEAQSIPLASPLESSGQSLIEEAVSIGKKLNDFDPGALSWIKNVELPLSNLLYGMHQQGFAIDTSRMASLEEEVLGQSEKGNPEAFNLLKYSLYPLKKHVKDGVVHTFFDQFSGRNNRVSTSRPQLQNLPKSELGRQLRSCLAPSSPSHMIMSFDYSQIEIVVLAHLSKDEKLLQALRVGADIHKFTAAEVFNVPLDQVSDKQRTYAKQINFGLIYGKTAFGLSKSLGIEHGEAQDYINRYFSRMSGAKAFLDKAKASAIEKGYVETLFGKRIRILDANSKESGAANRALRQATNAPMQGSAAEIVKRAMLTSAKWLKDNGIKGHLVSQVHDEIVLSVHKDDLALALDGVQKCMLEAAPFRSGVKLDAKIGTSYGTLLPAQEFIRGLQASSPAI